MRSEGSTGVPALWWCVAKTLTQVVVIWTLALAVVPWIILKIEAVSPWSGLVFASAPCRTVGVGLFAAASVLGLSSAGVMSVMGRGTPLPLDPPVRLVIAGAYRWVRNPMAIAGLAQGFGVALMAGSWSLVAYTACGFFVWNYGVRRWEEKDLLARFGAGYEAYRRSVRCWWPRARPVPRQVIPGVIPARGRA